MKNIFGNLFSKEKVNIGRQYEIDLLRGFTVIILIVCHVGLYLTTDYESGMFYFADIIGSEPAAPVFMMLMGISVVFSRNQNASYFLKRGLLLFAASYLLNIYRSFPYWITGELDYFACIQGFFVVDIFQFAGLTFLLFALFKKLKFNYIVIFIISIVFLIIGHELILHSSLLKFSEKESYVIILFLPLNNNWCCFNLLTWFIYPSFGLVLGNLLIRCKNKNEFYLILLIVGFFGIAILYSNICLRFPYYYGYYLGLNFYRMGIFNSCVTLLVGCFLLALWYFIGKIIPLFFKKYLTFLSKNISLIYILSWVFLAPIIHIQAYYLIEFEVIEIIFLMFELIFVCSIIPYFYRKIKLVILNKKTIKKTN